MGRPHQDRHTIKADLLKPARTALQRLDLFADPARFFLAVPMTDQANLFALFTVRKQRLAKPPLIARNHARRRGQNMRRRAVILLKPDNNSPRKILLEAQDVAHLGPAPAVNRLIIIAHTANILMLRRQKPQPQILRHVRILIFVDQNILKPALILLQNILMRLENRYHVQQNIAKIDSIQITQSALIGGV